MINPRISAIWSTTKPYDMMNRELTIGCNNCGLFAIATACAICHHEDPAHLKFDQKFMRENLIQAFGVA